MFFNSFENIFVGQKLAKFLTIFLKLLPKRGDHFFRFD
jgi:hypothetical protein